MPNRIEPSPLALNSPRWAELEHAYGFASDIPDLLRQLDGIPNSRDAEPWVLLWSALSHQGDVYPASFAAVPYVVQAIAAAPLHADAGYFQFSAVVELSRQRSGMPVPEDLSPAYYAALSKLPGLGAQAAAREWDDEFLRCVLSAIAAAKGATNIADAILELSPAVAKGFLDDLDSA